MIDREGDVVATVARTRILRPPATDLEAAALRHGLTVDDADVCHCPMIRPVGTATAGELFRLESVGY